MKPRLSTSNGGKKIIIFLGRLIIFGILAIILGLYLCSGNWISPFYFYFKGLILVVFGSFILGFAVYIFMKKFLLFFKKKRR